MNHFPPKYPHARDFCMDDEVVPVSTYEKLKGELRASTDYAASSNRLAFELTAALAQMPAGYEAGEAEFLSRGRVMELVVQWRMKWDALQKPQTRTEIVRPNGGMETALLEDIDRMREKIHVLGEALKHQRTALMIVRDRQGGRASDKDIDQGIKQIDAALSYIPPEPASGVLAVGNPRAAVRDALGVDTSLDAYHNLDGALIDLRRMKADAVCVRTIERVLSQIAAVLYLVEDGNERQALICEHYSRECSRNPPCVGVCLDAKDARENGRGFPSQGNAEPQTVEARMSYPDGCTPKYVCVGIEGRYAGWVFVLHADGKEWTTGAKLTEMTFGMLKGHFDKEADRG